MKAASKITARLRRKKAIQQKMRGTESRPRISVFRSAKHIYAQIINDETAQTLVAASTVTPEVRSQVKGTGNITAAQKVGEVLAKKAIQKGIKRVVFDRGGFLYHGRVKALAEAAREEGLEF